MFNWSWSKCKCLHKKNCLCKNVILDHQMISNKNTPNQRNRDPSESTRSFCIPQDIHMVGEKYQQILFSHGDYPCSMCSIDQCTMKTVWNSAALLWLPLAILHYVATPAVYAFFFSCILAGSQEWHTYPIPALRCWLTTTCCFAFVPTATVQS